MERFNFFTYSAYQNSKVEENFYLIGLEYIIVVGFFIYEFLGQEKIKTFLKRNFFSCKNSPFTTF